MKRYKINYESVPHGVISWRHDGLDSVYCEAGLEVRITWQPSAGWGLSEAHYTDAQGNEVAIDTNEMAFIMPESDITIGGTFKRFSVDDWEGYEGGGGGGTTDYTDLENKPSINGVTLQGNKTSEELGLSNHYTNEQIPVADAQGKLVDSGNKFLNSSAEVRPYADSEDNKIPTEKFLQKTLRNIELPEADKDAANKKYVDDLISELSGKVLRFKGFISPTAPTGTIKDGSMWYEGNALPTTFPINVKTYNATTNQWSSTTSQYTPESLDLWANLNDDKGYYWFGNGWNMIDDNGRFMYVSTFTGVIGNLSVLYYLDTAYDSYEKGFYRFIPASGGNPEKFVLLNKELFKYVSTFTGETGDVDRLYFLDTEYDTYKVGFYRFIEAQGTEPAKFVRIDLPSVKYVSTFNGVTGSTEALYYLDTAYDSYEVGFYRFVPASGGNPAKFVPIDRQRFKYVSTFTGEVGDLDRLYFLDTNYDEYTIGFYRYVEVEESGVTVGKFIHTGNPQQLQVTYAKLKEMRDSSKLVAGMQYRITDYACTTTQDDTQSANHPFDIIVTADSANKLNENAYAALHEGDTYFANNDLTAWKLKYCLDNDTSRFAWADTANGKGVVYYMKDEFNNECPYDFKNVQFKPTPNKVGVNNVGVGPGGFNRNYYYYTLSKVTSSSQAGISDNSLTGMYYCSNNRIGVYYNQENKITLNFNILLSSTEYQFCRNNSFGDMCRDNYCGAGFRINSLAYNCYNNSFGSNVYFMEFGGGCYNNVVDNGASKISLGRGCYNNVFSKQVANVKFGDVCYDNKIWDNSKNVSFSFSCYSNDLKANSETISFEANCYSNLIRKHSKFITLGHDCSNNTFGYMPDKAGSLSTITFGSSCKYNRVRNAIKKLDVGNNVNYCEITALIGDQRTISNLVVLDDTKGKSITSLLLIDFKANKPYTQYAGIKSDGKLRIWNIADIGDMEEKENIIDVTVLPMTDIDTDALYRLTTTHYYHNDTELTESPQGYKSLNEEALVADENGLTVIEGETSTTTPWTEVTDAMIATLVSGSLVATCEFGEAGFFKTAADEYDYAGNFSTTDTYKLWHNATGEPTDWLEVDSVGNLVTDGETTEDVDGELRANAIIEVQTLPATGYKQNSLYRMLDTATQTFKRYYYNSSADPLPETPTFYKGDGEHLVFGADGYTLNGNPGSYSSITPITMSVWTNNGWVSVTADFSEAGMFLMPGGLAVYDSTTKLTEEDYVVTAEMDKVFKRVQGGWECISYIQLDKEQYDILSEAQKNDGTLYIVNDEEG